MQTIRELEHYNTIILIDKTTPLPCKSPARLRYLRSAVNLCVQPICIYIYQPSPPQSYSVTKPFWASNAQQKASLSLFLWILIIRHNLIFYEFINLHSLMPYVHRETLVSHLYRVNASLITIDTQVVLSYFHQETCFISNNRCSPLH